MTTKEVEKHIESLVQVTPQQVLLAKATIFEHIAASPDDTIQSKDAIEAMLRSMNVETPKIIALDQLSETEAMIKQAAETISWQLAGAQAIWALITANRLFPTDSHIDRTQVSIDWTTAKTGSGKSGKLSLNKLSLPIPVKVKRSFSNTQDQPLSDADLFLHNLKVSGLHKEVEDSLREAVRCFRNELYRASLAMLGRAVEGAWIELGLKLASVVNNHSTEKAGKIRKVLESPYTSMANIFKETLRVYELPELEDVRRASEVPPKKLKSISMWAELARDSRNSVHYGKRSALPLCYENTAALLMGAVPHFRDLYLIYNAVDRVLTWRSKGVEVEDICRYCVAVVMSADQRIMTVLGNCRSDFPSSQHIYELGARTTPDKLRCGGQCNEIAAKPGSDQMADIPNTALP